MWLNPLRLLLLAPYFGAMFFPQKLVDFLFLQGKVSPPNHLGDEIVNSPQFLQSTPISADSIGDTYIYNIHIYIYI